MNNRNNLYALCASAVKNSAVLSLSACMFFFLMAAAFGEAPKESPAAKEKPKTWALLIAGSQYEAAYGRNLADWTARMHSLLTRTWGVDPACVTVLSEKNDKVAIPEAETPSVENVRKAFDRLRATVKAGDRFILFMVGHGQTNEPVGKLTLRGADLRSDELGSWLDRLPTKNIVVLLCQSGGAEFQANIGKAGRVVICAAGKPGQGNEVYFAEFLLRGYETKKADADTDGKITLLEAFNWAAKETVNWYSRQYLLPDDSWKILGKESCEIWKKLYEGSVWKMAASSTPNAPDAEPVWGPEPTPEWMSRRILTENASLEDLGEKLGAIIWINNEFKLLPGDEPDQEGFLARRIVLGEAGLLPEKQPQTGTK